ncbi:major facilitator superfamily transporter [Deinococcus aerius]|uniref:Major facilitator superfamily transporter n=1 Tax=Deinococcus aerius TaxID=200253 RepID=A0A2I9D1F4_9DEIO|nr:MFS transporter [Deinococcus aerius]GBF03850.1 major facilitator superfamily transporter [Deinococcus aerius]
MRVRLPPLPLRPGTGPGVAAAALALACAEFVRSGLYGAYLTQASPELLGLPEREAVAVAATAFSAHFLTDTLCRGPAGALIARYGARRVLLAGSALSLAALALLPGVHIGWELILMAAVHALGFAALWPAAMNLTAGAARPGYQGRALTLVSMCVMPMIGAGFLLLGALAPGGTTLVPLLVLGVQALGLIAVLGVPGRGPRLAAAAPTPRRRRMRVAARALAPLLPAALMQTLTLTLLGPLLFTLARELGLDFWGMVVMLVVGGAAAFGSMPLTGRVADRGRARLALVVGYSLIGLALGTIAGTPPVWALYGLAAVAGLGYAFVAPGWAALVAGTLPEAERPAAWGAVMTVENAGTALGPLVGAFAYRHLGTPGPFLVGAVLALLTAGGYTLFRHAFRQDAQPV